MTSVAIDIKKESEREEANHDTVTALRIVDLVFPGAKDLIEKYSCHSHIHNTSLTVFQSLDILSHFQKPKMITLRSTIYIPQSNFLHKKP